LRVRLVAAPGADADTVWRASRDELTHLLADNLLDDVTVERGEEPPHQTPGGKYRRVVPLE
jgi:hypothetical protein